MEFTLASLLVLTMFFGIIDLGRAVFVRALLTNAVREAARTGSIAPAALTDLRTAAANRSPGLGLTATSTVITTSCYRWSGTAWGALTNCGTARSGDRLVVEANYPFMLTATQLIGFGTIPMKERSQVEVQVGVQ